tara:strand:+ start:346 stop:552 length:207 start_codon:yes stop_codon:yes gene_type:complete
MSQSAITLGKIQVEFECLYGTKEMLKRLTQSERISELLRICTRENVSFKSFEYLEKKLILEKEASTSA